MTESKRAKTVPYRSLLDAEHVPEERRAFVLSIVEARLRKLAVQIARINLAVSPRAGRLTALDFHIGTTFCTTPEEETRVEVGHIDITPHRLELRKRLAKLFPGLHVDEEALAAFHELVRRWIRDAAQEEPVEFS